MESSDGKQDSASVTKVDGEPAVMIDGLPNLNPDFERQPTHTGPGQDPNSEPDPFLCRWLEGRSVRKSFGNQHYNGKVDIYDPKSNWFKVSYENGESENLEWRELEEVLVPLDISVPLRTLVLKSINK